ncbi:DUF6030 family protein [Rhizobium sp.]|uniref:DUF6030 family protein n=1 Tax=Rhizobium sp. TaxID=391 RepID=UPI002AA73783
MKQRAAQNAPEPNSMHLRTPQRARRGLWLFVGLLLLFVVGLGATLLLANGQRNLKLLSPRFEQMWPSSTRIVSQHKDEPPPAPRGKQISPQLISLPPHMFAIPHLEELSTIERTILFSGRTFCEKLNAAGLPNPGWAQSAFNPKTFDCTVDVAVPSSDPDVDSPSFFMVVRGDEAGHIIQIRWKVIDVKNSPKVWATYINSIDTLKAVSGWEDFLPQFDNMRAFIPFNETHFGLGFKLSKESSGAARYNISLMVENQRELPRNTRALLSARSVLPQAPIVELLWPRQMLN